MATEGQSPLIRSYVTAADLSTKQYYFVKLTADATVNICAAATDIPIGVLQNTPGSGQAATVVVIGETKLIANAAISAGAQIGTSSAGKAVALVAGTDTTKYVVGSMDHGASAGDVIATALVNCANPHRAA